ncbi:MAG TPA: DUF2157 domain-containing protein [Alphaproteobacteria bacterium]
MSIGKKLEEWQSAGLLTPEQMQNIRSYEADQPSAAKFIWRYGLLGLGLLIIMIGVVAIAASNWSAIPASLKLSIHLILSLIVAGGLFRMWNRSEQQLWRFEALLLFNATGVLTLMALLGQILQTQAPLEKTMLLWWTLITPMLLWLGKRRLSFILWTGLTIYVMATNLPDIPWLNLTVIIGLIQLYILLPLFNWWNTQKPGWSDHGRHAGVIASFIAINLFLVLPYNVSHDYKTAPDNTLESYAVEIALLLNIVLTFLIGFIRYRTLSIVTMWPQSNIWLRLTLAHLFFALCIYSMPGWFFWFILYWLIAGLVGLRMDDRKIVSLSITAIAIRMIVFYFEITQNLMTTGLLMIASGVGVIYLVKTYAQWRIALLNLLGAKP